ncbi:YfbU family protein [Bacillus paranthracis]|uniref:YfbU family protein n=1 Tax=Bacillus paranthracis TaxID=2026186 RepID=UPI00254DC347|nr:YfbU family protein [Bacillus paranthracis]MDK7537778.1 YfbU family protein [Bacillus paranthracis]MDK7561016.1 YfbU family protein [Bacillus paranthracis]
MEETLSKRERLILANQYDILSRLAEEEYEKKEFEDLRDIFASGYTRYYSLATEHFADEVDQEECKFVVDVLDLYRDLYYSREHSVEAKDAINESDVLFKGFDLNDEIESKYYSFYKFLVDQLGRYGEIKELMEAGRIESYNSHGFGPNMRKLAAMISKRNEIKDRDEYNRPNDLTTEEINEILNVQY